MRCSKIWILGSGWLVGVLAVILSLALLAPFAQEISAQNQKKKPEKQKLESSYKQWLERDVAYIITRDERNAFLKLTSDEARDQFIQQFWDLRNPSPGSPENTYKDEIYKRIAYANAQFGVGSGGEGALSDRGRAYITLGPPQEIKKFRSAPNLYPMEIWFYSGPNPALPTFFYLVFYQRDNVGDYRFYSPYMDGPDKLVTGTEAINDPQAALHLIEAGAGPEVAHIAQTLIPGEPLDPNGRIGLQSDIVLATIKNLANQPSNLAELDRRRQLVGTVTSRIVLNAGNLDIVKMPVRDSRGTTRLDYAIRLRNPADLSLTKDGKGNETFAVEVRVEVLTPERKLIFAQQKSVAGQMPPHAPDETQKQVFGYEGILPLPPGKYHLAFLLTDLTKKVGFRAERDVEIPKYGGDTFSIPAVLPFSVAESADRNKDGTIPFAMAGLRFRPLISSPLFLNPSQDLNVAYQIWAPAGDPRTNAGHQLDVEYALGNPAIVQEVKVIKDSVDMGAFTPTGVLVNGKKIPLAKESAGNYLFTVSVSNPGSSAKAHSEFGFQIVEDDLTVAPTDVDEPAIDEDEAKGVLDQQRALCYLSQGLSNEARIWFRVALKKNPENNVARAHLVEAYFTLNDFSAVVSLFSDAGITAETDSQTIARVGESLLKTGDTPKAVSVLQDAIHSRPQDGELYIALADCYKKMGDSQKEQEMLRKGQAFLRTDPSAPPSK